MNTFDYAELLAPLALGATNLFFAGVLHRAIVRSSTLLRRRHFFELLAVFAFAVALVLMLGGFALWGENPRFVLAYGAAWALACTLAAAVLRHRNRRRAEAELTLPDAWPPATSSRADANAGAGRARTDGDREPVPLDALTRARLKKARRERLDGTRRLRNRASGTTRDLPERGGR